MNRPEMFEDMDHTIEIVLDCILKRADVTWRDDPIKLERVVTSRNTKEPLTVDEQNIIRRMWKNQGISFTIIFEED